MHLRPIPEDVAALALEFDAWRRSRRHLRERVPSNLWKKALAAARAHTIGVVARGLKLDRRKLRNGLSAVPESKKAGIVRFAPVTLLSAPAPSSVVEIEDPAGWRLRISGVDYHAAVKAFVEARR